MNESMIQSCERWSCYGDCRWGLWCTFMPSWKLCIMCVWKRIRVIGQGGTGE
ncbi:hypothetical protein Hdeb2414_s0028g00703111 [Helianthus debilis subsp. tardiflorus]